MARLRLKKYPEAIEDCKAALVSDEGRACAILAHQLQALDPWNAKAYARWGRAL